MIKLIFKTLWARRTRNAWIVLELVIVTMIMWIMVDKIVVSSYIQNLDPGYDADRLFTIELNEYGSSHSGYDESQCNQEARTANIMRILQRLRQLPDVESATIANKTRTFNGGGFSISALESADSVTESFVYVAEYFPNTEFFKTFGIKNEDGTGPYVEADTLNGGCIITATAAHAAFPDKSPIGGHLFEREKSSEEIIAEGKEYEIIGDVVGDVINNSNAARSMVVFERSTISHAPSIYILVARKREGVSDKAMLRELREALPELRSGIVYTRDPQPYANMTERTEHDMNVAKGLSYAVMVFFMVNICLALIATFYVQIRTRSRDAGIMRAYGFRRGTIMMLMIAEGWILTFISWIIGTAIFFLAGLDRYLTTDKFQSAQNLSEKFYKIYNPMWYDDLANRACVIGGIGLLLLLLIVTLGIWLPARRIAHVNPADTIRDL